MSDKITKTSLFMAVVNAVLSAFFGALFTIWFVNGQPSPSSEHSPLMNWFYDFTTISVKFASVFGAIVIGIAFYLIVKAIAMFLSFFDIVDGIDDLIDFFDLF